MRDLDEQLKDAGDVTQKQISFDDSLFFSASTRKDMRDPMRQAVDEELAKTNQLSFSPNFMTDSFSVPGLTDPTPGATRPVELDGVKPLTTGAGELRGTPLPEDYTEDDLPQDKMSNMLVRYYLMHKKYFDGEVGYMNDKLPRGWLGAEHDPLPIDEEGTPEEKRAQKARQERAREKRRQSK